MAVRSRRLFGPVASVLPNARQPVYVVPAGRTAIFRSIIGYWTSNGTMYLGLGDIDFANRTLSVNNHVNFCDTGVIILNPGDVLTMTCSGIGGGRVTGFGTLLLGAPV